MRRDLPHLVSAVFNTPLMIEGDKLETILDAIGARLLSGSEIKPQDVEPPKTHAYSGQSPQQRFSAGGYLAGDGIAVLPIVGTLVRRGTYLDSLSGMTSYAAIDSAITEMLGSTSVRGVMMELDTPGGEAGGVFDLTNSIVANSQHFGKPIWAFVNEMAASAGYAIASAADQIWIPQMGFAGSIGVVMAHVDVSEADKKAGLKWTYIKAGDRKTDGNPHEPLSKNVEKDLQALADSINDDFIALVSNNRLVAEDEIRAMQARVYRGAEAVEIGLADKLGTFPEALNAFAEFLDLSQSVETPYRASTVELQRKVAMPKRAPEAKAEAEDVTALAMPSLPPASASSPASPARAAKASKEVVEPEDSGEEESESENDAGDVGASAPEPSASIPASAGSVSTGASLEAERVRCAELAQIGATASRLGVAFDLSAAIKNGSNPDSVRQHVLDAAAAKCDSSVTSTVGAYTQADARDNDKTAVPKSWDASIDRVTSRLGLKKAG